MTIMILSLCFLSYLCVCEHILPAGRVVPINIKKGLQHPTLVPDSELPEWVFEASKPERTLEDLEAQAATKGVSSLTAYEQKRIKKLRRRNLIKNNNYEREIGLVLSK